MIEKSANLQAALLEALALVGVDHVVLAQKLREGLGANRIEYFSSRGKVTDSAKSADYPTRERYLRTIMETQGILRSDREIALNLGVIAVSQVAPTELEWDENVEKK